MEDRIDVRGQKRDILKYLPLRFYEVDPFMQRHYLDNILQYQAYLEGRSSKYRKK